ncbi:MAG: Holliday junction branch migration protein RuvA [Planctomycetes bacterium]|nr:Holliday junction branch migration protein RuvA [Planctomycetota bacterium]
MLTRRSPAEVVVESGGVGYRVRIPPTSLEALGLEGGEVRLWLHLHVREDAHLLYGFLTRRERDVFEALLRVSGVGPVSALAVLSGMSVEDLAARVRAGDEEALSRPRGIGRKTAKLIIAQLSDRLDRLLAATGGGVQTATGAGAASRREEDAVLALQALGYKEGVARRSVRSALASAGAGADLQALVKAALAADA